MNDHDGAIDDILRWRTADEGFWVGTRAGCFAGTIDQNGSHFYARNQFGEYLGDYPDLGRAQHALQMQFAGISVPVMVPASERSPRTSRVRTLQGAA
jgi:hypothetical protein